MAQGFDPAAATAAYLAELPPEAHAKAQAYTQGGHWLLLWGALVAVVVAWLILRSGLLARITGRVEAKKPRPWAAAAVVGVVYSIASDLLSLPWEAYAHWWREKGYGLTSQPFAGWLREWGINLGLDAVLSVILLSLLYFAIRRFPRTWWLWSGAGVAAAFIAVQLVSPVLIEPLFNSYKPAPPGAMRDEVVAMAKQVGVPSDKIVIYNGSKQSNRYTANVAGLFSTARVAMSDVMFAKNADLAEVRGVVGHEMGHYVRGHLFLGALSYGLVAALAFFLIGRLFPWAARVAGAKGVRGLADPAGYPVFSMLLTVILLVASPITNSISRLTESDADRFSVENFNEPDGLSRALVKTIEYRAATPSKLEEVLFYDHPAVGARIRSAMDWKAKHMAAPPKPPSAS